MAPAVNGVLVFLSLVAVIGMTAAGAPLRQRIASGTWGGMHIRIEVSARSASIEYDCANGTIDGPLNLDADGNFSLTGTHRRERGGPIRKDARAAIHPALYTGTIKGDSMTLSVKLTDNDEDLGTFTLERGSVGRVYKCK